MVNQIGGAIPIGIKLLLHIQVVMPVKHGMNSIGEEQALNRHRPTRTFCGKVLDPIGARTTPFKIGCILHATARVAIESAPDKVVNENKLEGCGALRQHAAQPLILRNAQRPRPRIEGLGCALAGLPEGIQNDEERVAPLE